MSPPQTALPRQEPTLVLDCSTIRVQVGILQNDQWLAFLETEGDALETIFSSINKALHQTGKKLSDIQAAAIGVGPGSILGLRLALMALETWLKLPELQHWQCFTFHGLQVQAHLLEAQGESDFHLVSDFRNGSWHYLKVKDGSIGELEIVDDEQVRSLSGKIHYSPTGRGRQKMPLEKFDETPFSLSALEKIAEREWAFHTDTLELYLPSPPVFKKWDARPHRR